MSVQSAIRRKTAPDIRARKGADPIVMLTSYHAHTAALLDRHCDVILVGDSLGNVMHGFETTAGLSLRGPHHEGDAVRRGKARGRCAHGGNGGVPGRARHSCHGPYRAGATVDRHARLVSRPGRDQGSWEPIENDARALAEAGAFSVVIEAVAEPLARKITENIAIPTIGIGASAACDGPVLVLEDMLGLSPRTPKFVRRYGNLAPAIEAAVEGYARDVRGRSFPGPEHIYGMKQKS